MKFDPMKRRLWCHGPRPEFEADDDWADQWYIPARVTALVRPGRDIVVLPGGNQQTRAFAEFCCEVLGLEPGQIRWTSGSNYLMDVDIATELAPELMEIANDDRWQTVPYTVTDPFLKWAGQLNGHVFGDHGPWVKAYGTKAILHPNAISALRESSRVPLLPRDIGVRVAHGYTCGSSAELWIAHARLSHEGITKFMIKPVAGATGEGIIEVTTRDEIETYDFPLGAVVLEEKLEIDRDTAGQRIAPSIQYFGSELIEGGPSDQLFGPDGVAYKGNVVPSIVSSEFARKMLAAARKVLEWFRPQGPGGFDFLSVGGEPVLIDPNVGRFTGAHPARLFGDMYAPKIPLMCWKTHPENSVHELWERLNQRGIAFDPRRGSTRGVFPLCHLPHMWGMLVAFGNDRDDLFHLRAQAEECL